MTDQGTRAVAFNVLTAAMNGTAWIKLSDRQKLAYPVADAVDELARASEAALFWDAAKDFPEPFRGIIADIAARHSLPRVSGGSSGEPGSAA